MIRKNKDMCPDAIISDIKIEMDLDMPFVGHAWYVELDAGTMDNPKLIEKSAAYIMQGLLGSKTELCYVFCNNKEDYINENFLGLFMKDLTSIRNIYITMKKYQMDFEEFILICKCYIDEGRIIEGDEGILDTFIKSGYKKYNVERVFLSLKTLQGLKQLKFMNKFSVGTDIEFLYSFIHYCEKHKYSNQIKTCLRNLHNLAESEKRKYSLIKAIVKRLNRKWEMDMLFLIEHICAGNDIFWVTSSEFEQFITIPNYMTDDDLLQELMLEYASGYKYYYYHEYESRYYTYYDSIDGGRICKDCSIPFSLKNRDYDLIFKNRFIHTCENDNVSYEVYIENISDSISAIVRCYILYRHMLGINLINRKVVLVCRINSVERAIEFQRFMGKGMEKTKIKSNNVELIYYSGYKLYKLDYDDKEQNYIVTEWVNHEWNYGVL